MEAPVVELVLERDGKIEVAGLLFNGKVENGLN